MTRHMTAAPVRLILSVPPAGGVRAVTSGRDIPEPAHVAVCGVSGEGMEVYIPSFRYEDSDLEKGYTVGGEERCVYGVQSIEMYIEGVPWEDARGAPPRLCDGRER